MTTATMMKTRTTITHRTRISISSGIAETCPDLRIRAISCAVKNTERITARRSSSTAILKRRGRRKPAPSPAALLYRYAPAGRIEKIEINTFRAKWGLRKNRKLHFARFGPCAKIASSISRVLALAQKSQAPFRAFWPLRKSRKLHFARFGACAKVGGGISGVLELAQKSAEPPRAFGACVSIRKAPGKCFGPGLPLRPARNDCFGPGDRSG